MSEKKPGSEQPQRNGSPRVVSRFARVPIGIGLAYAIWLVVYRTGCAVQTCVDVGGLLWILLGAVVAVPIAVWYGFARLQERTRQAVDIAAAVIVLLAFVGPMIEGRWQSAKRQRQTDAANEHHRLRMQWIDSLRRQAHGPVGEVPPMLEVRDDGNDVNVTNRGGQSLTVAIARVRPDALGIGGWRSCNLVLGGPYYTYRHSLAPSESRRLKTEPQCADAFKSSALEYRVGNGAGDVGWWSDSAFSAIEGRGYVFPRRRR